MPVELIGFRELLGELATLEGRTRRTVAAGLRAGAEKVAAKSNEYAPRGKSGNLSANGKPFVTTRAAGVRYTLIYAPVQEFAVDWLRKSRGSGGGSVTRGQKKAHFAGGVSVAGTNEVHYTKGGPTPRFAFKALNELQDALVTETFVQLVAELKANGWFS